ncbi:glycoside hydrolase family 32 protein [Mixia osmundae IAM 14324]|nr:glycoside hydrolase family 32 protein [Mixia osmundae IAM 14324]KEI39741.1 glycoside hydrolase family 32 protein [Mixia osmundae IAM 14324]
MSAAILLSALALATVSSATPRTFVHHTRSVESAPRCSLDRSKAPGDLTTCGNSTLFDVWRPKARFIAPNSWMNDPQGAWQREDGSFHIGYQCHVGHINWGNISMCAAVSDDLTTWRDINGWRDPATLGPKEVYDIRGVFDGSIIKSGINGFPTQIYTSTFPHGTIGATAMPAEEEGAETVSLAWTEDEGKSWKRLPLGDRGNPVIWQWPMKNLTGFRDPFAFRSPVMSKLLASSDSKAQGDLFLTMSSGLRKEAYPTTSGIRLFLYRQTTNDSLLDWTYLGPLMSEPANATRGEWSGSIGINEETTSVIRLDEQGRSDDDGTDKNAIDFILFGTEHGRNGSRHASWPLWSAVSYSATKEGSVTSKTEFGGILDWGMAYAFAVFPAKGKKGEKRSVTVGWTQDDQDDAQSLVNQRGYHGAFTLFRDLFVKKIVDVDSEFVGLQDKGNWKVQKEANGTVSILTLGQKIVPETLDAYKKRAKASAFKGMKLDVHGGAKPHYKPFPTQPEGQHYVIKTRIDFEAHKHGKNEHIPRAGFRVLASEKEYTDVIYDFASETLSVERNHSSLIASYGNTTEYGKLRLWPVNGKREKLDLTIVVDGSVIEVYANDVTVITARAYPWLKASKAAGWLLLPSEKSANKHASVKFGKVELWDLGAFNAFPDRPENTSMPLVWDGAYNSLIGLWAGN